MLGLVKRIRTLFRKFYEECISLKVVTASMNNAIEEILKKEFLLKDKIHIDLGQGVYASVYVDYQYKVAVSLSTNNLRSYSTIVPDLLKSLRLYEPAIVEAYWAHNTHPAENTALLILLVGSYPFDTSQFKRDLKRRIFRR